MDLLKSTKQVAEELSIAPGTLRRIAERDKIGRKVGHAWVFTEADIVRLTKRQMGPGRPKGYSPKTGKKETTNE